MKTFTFDIESIPAQDPQVRADIWEHIDVESQTKLTAAWPKVAA